jgi:hypothetical protein
MKNENESPSPFALLVASLLCALVGSLAVAMIIWEALGR